MKRILFCHRIIIITLLSAVSHVAAAQSVGLVLSGGGAKGLSHIGVIKALEENGIPIDYIGGTSIGSIVGGFYAIGLSTDDMIAIIRSDEFRTWYKGTGEREFYSYLYSGYPTAAMINIDFQFKKKSVDSTVKSDFSIEKKKYRRKYELKIALPTSYISSYPMDMALIQIFANASAAADYDFDKLMVPFFCVAGDIIKKEPFISDHGDLGSAVRASMAIPAYFKPVIIDSVLLFDGGLYDNFPWKIMDDKYSPDFIIGSQCVEGNPVLSKQDEVPTQIELLVSSDTDYSIPDDKGIVIAGKYDCSLLEFDKVDELVEQGYNYAMKHIDEIKARVKRRRLPEDVDSMRVDFRKRCLDIQFDKVKVNGNLTESQKSFIEKTFLHKGGTLSLNDVKRSYFRMISTNTVRTFYPTAAIGRDSLFTLNLFTTPKNALSLSVGGNISSSSLMQGALGLSHIHFSKHPWNSAVNLDVGQFFSGVGLYFRQHIGIKPLFLYEAMFNFQMFDYFGSSRNVFLVNSPARNIQENETYATVNVGTPLSYRYSLLLECGATGGRNYYRYYPTEGYSKYDKPHKTYLDYFTARLKVAQTTLDYNLFPTSGRKTNLEMRYIFGHEKHEDGTMLENNTMEVNPWKNVFLTKLDIKDYYSINRWFSLGYEIDITASTLMNMCDYTSTVAVLPSFHPTNHSETMFLESYRAPVFIGAALSPVFKINETLYFHITAGYFQPYKALLKEADGMYEYSQPFPKGGFLGNVAFVWQSPVGPISLSCAYYEKGERMKWYPALNIGFLIFRSHGLRN